MSKSSRKELLKLVRVSKMVGYNLIIGEKIELIATDNGELNIVSYDSSESDCVQKVKRHIRKKARKMRDKWGDQLLEFSAIGNPVNHSVHLGKYCARVIALEDINGNLILKPGDPAITDPKKDVHKIVVLECPFSLEGVKQLSDYFSNLLYIAKSAEIEDYEDDEDEMYERTDEETISDMLEALSDTDILEALLRKWRSYTDEEKAEFAEKNKNGLAMYVINGAEKMADENRLTP